MIGATHHVSVTPPVSIYSFVFIATSMEIIDDSDMPSAVFSAITNAIWRAKIMVLRVIDVKRPLKMAKDIIQNIGQAMPES